MCVYMLLFSNILDPPVAHRAGVTPVVGFVRQTTPIDPGSNYFDNIKFIDQPEAYRAVNWNLIADVSYMLTFLRMGRINV